MAANKTDANDADGLAHLAEVGFFREVRVKGYDSILTRTLVAARLSATQLSNPKTDPNLSAPRIASLLRRAESSTIHPRRIE